MKSEPNGTFRRARPGDAPFPGSAMRKSSARAAHIAAFTFVLLTGLSFATDACQTDFISNTQYVGMALILTVVLISLAYMASQITQSEKLEVWAKDELFQLLLSVVLVTLVAGLAIGACTFSKDYMEFVTGPTGYTGASPFLNAYHYLDSLINRQGVSLAKSIVKSGINEQLKGTKYVFWGLPLTGGCGIAYEASRKARAQEYELLVDLMMPAMVSLELQKNLLMFAETMGMAVLLPFAVVLRIIPFTRDAGNFLIALSLGVYVVLPATYVLNAYAAGDPTAGITSDPTFRQVEGKIGDPIFATVIYSIGSILPQAILLPNISIIILTAFVMGFNKALKSIEVLG